MRARLLMTTATAVLFTSGLTVPAAAVPPTPPDPTASATAGQVVPCPRMPTPKTSRPPRAAPPPVPAEDRALREPALDTAGLVVPAGAPTPPRVSATSWLVADLDTGQVLGGCGPYEHATPASVQKLLLAATMLPKLDPEQVVKVTAEDMEIEPGSSAVGLVEGGRYKLETVWLGLLLNSGNEAANLLARLGGGDDGVAGGVAAMNEYARHLGALQTHAVTPSGLDAPGQFTSAYDLALIARACFANPDFRRYARTESTRIPAQKAKKARAFQIQNDNRLLYNYPGAIGGKTGFTDLARHTYVGAAERDGRRLVVTLLGAEAQPKNGWEQGAALLDWGFGLPRTAAVGRLVEPGELAERASPEPSPEEAEELNASPAASSPRQAGGVDLFWPLVALAVAATALFLVVQLKRRSAGQRR